MVERMVCYHSRSHGGVSKYFNHDRAGVEFRDVCALYAELHHLHRGISRTSEVQRAETFAHSDLRSARKLDLYAFLSHRAIHGVWHEDGTLRRLRNRRGLGHLRSHLLREIKQGFRAPRPGGEPRGEGLIGSPIASLFAGWS